MRRPTALTAVLALGGSLCVLPTAADAQTAQPPTEDPSTIRGSANAQEQTFDLWKGWSHSGGSRAPGASGGEVKVHTRSAFICFSASGEEPANDQGWCGSGVPQTPVLTCDGEEFTPPTWRQLEYPDGTTTPWQRLDEGSCGPVLPVLTVEDFRSLPIPAPVLRLQPDRGWVLINIETIVTTDDTPVPLRTTLAGVGVDVQAIPQVFTYDFGDGHDLVTRSAGHPYPDHDTFHEYETPGTYAITLTTE